MNMRVFGSLRSRSNPKPKAPAYQPRVRRSSIEFLEPRCLLNADGQLVFFGIDDSSISPTNSGLLLVADLESEQVAPIRAQMGSMDPGYSGLAFVSRSELFASTSNGPLSASNLVNIDPISGERTSSQSIRERVSNAPVSMGDLAVQPGTRTLFGIGAHGNAGTLYVIDPATGVADIIGSTNGGTSGGLGFAPDGTLYLTGVNVDSDPVLQTIDPATAQILTTVVLSNLPIVPGVPNIPDLVNGLDVDAEGTIVGADTVSGRLFTIDPDTGERVVIPLDSVDHGTAGDVAFQPGAKNELVELFHADFESSDNDGFTVDNSGGTFNGLWHDTLGRSQDNLVNHSPTHSFYYGRFETLGGGGQYDVLPEDHRGVLISPSIDIPDDGMTVAGFNYVLDTRLPLDVDFVDVSVDNGTSTTVVLSRQDGTLPQTGRDKWWTSTIDLTPFAGQTIQLRFSFDTGDPPPFDPEGWYVDDVWIANVREPIADLSVTKQVDDDTPNEGQTVTYTITATNSALSEDDATDVMVEDDLPEGVTIVSAVPSAGTYDEAADKWTIPELSIGETATLVIMATVDAGTAGMTLPNTAQVMGDQTDPNPDDNMDTEEITVNKMDLSVTKEVDDVTPDEGQELTYTITVTNSDQSNVDATNVMVLDDLPAGVTFVSAVPSAGTYDEAADKWTIPLLPIGEMATLQITVIVDLGTCGMTLANTAQVMGDETDPDPENNLATREIIVNCVDLSVTKEVDDDTPNEGQELTYTITVTNSDQSNVDATNVMVLDDLPDGVTFVSDNPSAGTYDEVANKWSIPVLPIGETATLQITVIVDLGTCGMMLANTAQVMGDQTDPDPEDNLATREIIVNCVDLSVTKEVNDDTPGEGQTITYTITAANSIESNVPGSDVMVVENLPSGVTFVSTEPSVGTYDEATDKWSFPELAIGGAETLVITATVDAGTSGMTLPNTAVIMGNETDPNPENNTSTEEITVAAVDLSITKLVDDDTPNEGQTLEYTITVTNSSASNGAARDVKVVDDFPPGLTCTADPPSMGAHDATTGIWTIDELAIGESETIIFQCDVDAGTAGMTLTNTANVTFDGTDPNPSNDDASESVTVNSADLSVTKIVDDDTPNVVQEIVYTIEVTNEDMGMSIVPATNVVVVDMLPEGVTFVSADPPDGVVFDPQTRQITWTLQDAIPVGAMASLDITVRVNAETFGMTLSNTADVTSDETDPDPSNNEDMVDVTVNSVDLSVTKLVDDETPDEGQTIVYTITALNSLESNAIATNVEVVDMLPAGITFVSADPSMGSYDESIDTWTLPELLIGEMKTLTITASVDAGASGVLTNVAVISGDESDPNDDDNTATETVSIGQTIQFITPLSIYRLNGPIEVPTDTVVPNGGTISGFKWHDLNQDGVWDSDEPVRAGWRVFLDSNNDQIFDPETELSAVTRDNGEYVFTGLTAGQFIVREDRSLLSDGTFTAQQFPLPDSADGSRHIIDLAEGEVVAGTDGVAQTPNFGGFDFSTLTRPADNLLGLAQIERSATSEEFDAGLTPWQSFTIDNPTDTDFNILSFDLSNLGSPGDRLVTIVDESFIPTSLPITVANGASVKLYAFYDPAIREGTENERVVEQFPDWRDDPDTLDKDESQNPPHTFPEGAHLIVETSDMSFRVNVVGGSTFDSDIFYDGNVDRLDVEQFDFSSSGPGVATVAGESSDFDPSSDMNARCPNGAEGVIVACSWPLDGTPAREIGMGDFIPLNVEFGKTRTVIAPVLGVVVPDPFSVSNVIQAVSPLSGGASVPVTPSTLGIPTSDELVVDDGGHIAVALASGSESVVQVIVDPGNTARSIAEFAKPSGEIQGAAETSTILLAADSNTQQPLANIVASEPPASHSIGETTLQSAQFLLPVGLQFNLATRSSQPFSGDLGKPTDKHIGNSDTNESSAKTATAEPVDFATLAYYESEGLGSSSLTSLPQSGLDDDDIDQEDTEEDAASNEAVDAVFADVGELDLVEQAVAGN